MAEYIDREKLIEKFCWHCEATACGDDECFYKRTMYSIPAADVQPVKHGRWLDSTYKYSEYNYDCSVCGCNEYRQVGKNGRYRAFKYCPECGADMRIGSDITNADRIRAMSDKDLADLLSGGEPYPWCEQDPCPAETCQECILMWLKQEAKE